MGDSLTAPGSEKRRPERPKSLGQFEQLARKLLEPGDGAELIAQLSGDDGCSAVGRLPPAPGPPLVPPDAPTQPCKFCCFVSILILTLVLLVLLIVALALAIVPFLILLAVGCCCFGKSPKLLAESDGVPSRPQSKIGNTATIKLRDGRQLEYIAVGPRLGVPAVFFHGWGASAPCFCSSYCESVFTAHGLRVYSISLPGWGLSDTRPEYRGWGCWRCSRSTVRVVTFSFLCPLLEKYGTFIARCNALIEKVSSFRADHWLNLWQT
eukprot:SAG31_NODE_1797_length_7244_cov_8.328621_6_plen_266_part_00